MIDLTTKHLTVFRAGSFGSELIRRLLQTGIPKEQITVCDPNQNLAHTTADQAICEADALLLALPAKAILEMLPKVSPCLVQPLTGKSSS